MKTTKLLKVLTLATGLVAGVTATAGDVYEINPCDAEGNACDAYATAAKPLTSGETLYFKLRLIPRALGGNLWRLGYTGYSLALDSAVNPLQIGIYVSGQLKYATLVGQSYDTTKNCSDFIFSYETVSGDFALPIVLATKDGPADEASSPEFLLNPLRTDKWVIANAASYDATTGAPIGSYDTASLQYWTASATYPDPSSYERDQRGQDYTLKSAGFYVKTLDFDSNWETADTLWRSVHQDGTQIVGSTPRIVSLAGGVAEKTTLYVWSDNEDAVYVAGGTPTEITYDYVGGVAQKKTVHLYTVEIAGGAESADLSLYGVAEGGTANLVLSPYPGYRFDSTKGRLDDNYVTVPVACVEPMPTTVMVRSESTDDTVYASSATLTAADILDVYVTQPVAEDLVVTITPSVLGQALTMSDYVRFSTTAASVKTLAALTETATVTIPANQSGAANAQKVYVYALRADDLTSGDHTVDFTPSISDAQKASTGIENFDPAGVELVARNPVITSPAAGASIEAIANVARDLEIEVDDTYADRQVADPDTGYTIEIKYRDSDSWKTLAGTYYYTSGVLKDKDGNFPQVTYTTSGSFTSSLRVTEPINKNTSAIVQFSATVSAPRTVTVTTDADTYNEGASAKFTITLSSPNDTGAALYAFLVAGPDDATADKFSALGRKCVLGTDTIADPALYALTKGIAINPDNDSATATVKLLDGASEDAGGSSYYFSVVLCESATYDPNQIVSGYNSNFASIQVFNVEPTITRVEMNGFEVGDDNTFEGSYPVGQAQTFQAIVKDPGSYDLNTDFQTRWTFTRNGGGVTIPVQTITANPNTDAGKCTVTFTQAGTYKIKTQVKDKDMDDWAEAYAETYVVVVAQPQLTITLPNGDDSVLETDRAKIAVGLGGYYNATEPMVVMLTVSSPDATSENPGKLVLDASYATAPAGYEAYEGDGKYFVQLSGTASQEITVTEMDGTALTSTPGFSIKAEVLNTGISTDGVKTWAEYYLSNSVRYYIDNVTPVCVVTEPGTNSWKVAGGPATAYPIRWAVRSDVDEDYTHVWSDGVQKGIKVSFTGCDNAAEGTVYVTSKITGTSGTFIPNFGSSQGDQTVTMTIEDKDGGYQTWTYSYTVEASKFLVTRAAGPSGGTASAPSPKYNNAKGIGAGRTWVNGMKISTASNFDLTWNCSKAQTASVYGYGYKVGDTETTANLPGSDYVKLDANGGIYDTGDTAYAYADTTYDSYLYTWILYTTGDSGTSSSSGQLTAALLGGLAPETSGKNRAAAVVSLPSELQEDGSYLQNQVEAIFSREWRATDNCGDINQDGIPDLAVLKYGLGVYDVDAGTVSGNDLTDVSSYNDDGDYLPAGTSGGLDIIPNIASDWPSQGQAFNAYLELRGFGFGLNAYPNAAGNYEPDYTENEKRAYLAWKGLATEADLKAMADADVDTLFTDNYAAAAADLKSGAWTPENPTDPSAADSDSDGLPDGYEYWFWYAAKVGFTETDANGNKVWTGRLVGKRFQAANLEAFVDIPADDICAAFNPNVSGAAEGNAVTRGSLATRDFDNDGLRDLEELAMGTNPVSCDTDGDTLPDGYEVMWGLNPVNGADGDGGDDQNPDGDAMAMATFAGQVLQVGDAAPYTFYLTEQTETVEAGDTVKASSLGTGDTIDDVLRTLNGKTIPKTIAAAADVTFDAAPTPVTDPGITLIHDQVYKFYGFDPRTAWSTGCAHGALTARWCKTDNSADGHVAKVGDAGKVVNTVPYTTKWEYLYGKYTGAATGTGSALSVLASTSTNPNAAFEDKTYGTNTTTWASTQHGADTNGDGVPDGWEIYCGGNPIATSSPWGAANADADDLSNAAEFAGQDSVAVYAACGSISSNNTVAAGWLNKFLPTDPKNADTDGDGLSDSDEGATWSGAFMAGRQTWPASFTFIYGDATDDGLTLCFRGGGLNPCTADTDFDAIPDGWEHQYAGIVVTPDGSVADQSNNQDEMYTDALKIADGVAAGGDTNSTATASGNYIMGGMDGTDGYDDSTHMTKDAITGTVRDRDFDHDGLENFQEYLVQAVRAWRYDDTETPLNGRAIIWSEGDAAVSDVGTEGFVTMDVADGEAMMNAVKASALWDTVQASLTYAGEPAAFDYAALGYLAPADRTWDPTYQMGHRFMRMPQTAIAYTEADGAERVAGAAYVSTDPRTWDSDNDGMDDYWEVFHGLNPILGASDLVAESYAEAVFPIGFGPITYDFNVWNGLDGLYDIEDPGLDPLLAPWTTGLADADPDGDGLRNIDESIMGNMTTPTTYHTDPSPFWLTDDSSPISVTSQYYPLDAGGYLSAYQWTWTYSAGIGTSEGAAAGYMFSFERTEGYDTDGDFRTDGQEVVKGVQPISDPLDATDPDRRTALYLDGENSCAVSYMTGNVPVVDAYDVFRQFTVECWVKPEKTGAEQTIVERGFTYAPSNVEHAEPAWRANFRLALNETGNVYGMFDNDNPVASGSDAFSSQSVTGGVLPLDTWSHVALAFDGTTLALYVNGRLTASAKTGLIPANGVTGILQEPANTNAYPMAEYQTAPGMNTIGARCAVTDFSLDGDFDQFTDFYQGYVDEVRFWDGARSADEIAANYLTRMSQDDVAANRTSVYEAWVENATRNDNDGADTLPAQLMSLYNFQQLPAAVNAADVVRMPSGFQHVLNNLSADASLAEVGWWTAMAMKSTVYADYHVVPWIQNAVSHLALMDDSFADSMYWSEPYAGYTAAAANGVATYAIPNGGNPYSGRSYSAETDFHYWRLVRVALSAADETTAEYANKYAFQARSEFVGLDDLIPLGGAFAKLDADYWDGQGASTAWSDTGRDDDGDGLPDWWEALHGGTDLTPTTMIDYNGQTMPAWQAYMRDLAAGMQPDGTTDATYAAKVDTDGDGLVDWWQNLYSLEGGANGDDDGDGLANYVEYLLAEVFKIKNEDKATFDPTDAFSMQNYASDYFFPVGESYVGEIFTDHDRIADTWEDKYSNAYATRYLYDADADGDDDGWGNFAEFQADTDPTQLGSLGVDATQMTEYPVPTIETILTYEGTQNTADKPFVVKAWRDASLQTIPDAVWTIGGSGDTSTTENGNTNTVTGTKIVGMNPGKEVLYHLSPGSVVTGTVVVEFKDPSWFLYNSSTGQRIIYGSSTAVWEHGITDSQHTDDPTTGDLVYGVGTVVGSINYVTGATTIDFTKLPTYLQIIGNIAESATTSSDDLEGNYRSVYTLASSYVRISWNSQPITGGSSVHYYLADADARTTDNNSVGHVKEGRNTFVAFCDLDGDGNYTAGEPFGVAPNVNVGWNYAKVSIELTDTTPVTARFSVGGDSDSSSSSSSSESGNGGEVANDRTVLWGIESGNYDIANVAIGKTSGGVFERVRVVRTFINGTRSIDFGVPNCVVLDKVVNVNNDPYLTEADFLQGENYDIDWATLADDLAKANKNLPDYISNITYRVVLGNGSVEASTTNNLLGIAFNRWFDAPEVYEKNAKPVTLGPGIVTAAAPTFRWTIPNGLNSYTAFEIIVQDESGSDVWDSGLQPMPPRIKDADYGWRYEWTAPIYADGKTPDGTTVFANNKNYTWYVALANARYREPENWSDGSAFRMNVLTNSADYGTVNVAVRYFGPARVATSGSGLVRVQAFTTPDFSGAPVGEGYVTTTNDIANAADSVTANATIIGLEAGTYYIRAFIDTVADGSCATWESWGFLCDRDTKGAALYTPKSITVGPKVGMSRTVTVFIDDCDTDQDNLPDAWEWNQKGDLSSLDVGSLDQPLTGSIAVKKSLTDVLSGDGSLTTGLAVMLSSSLNSPYVAAMVMGVDVSDASSATEAAQAVTDQVGAIEQTAEPKKVAFTAITLDPTAKTVTLKTTTVVDSTTSGNVDATVAAIYTFETTGDLTVTFRLWKKDALTDATWTEIGSAQQAVTVGEGAETVTLNLGQEVDLSNGFFKVTLEK